MEYVLDVSKWRCGGPNGEWNPNALGEGECAELLNVNGYMCCLGLFAKQKRIPKKDMLELSSPEDLANAIGKVYDPAFVEFDMDTYNDTDLANELMGINDDYETTYKEKIELIRKKLEKHGHTLKVINDPGE